MKLHFLKLLFSVCPWRPCFISFFVLALFHLFVCLPDVFLFFGLFAWYFFVFSPEILSPLNAKTWSKMESWSEVVFECKSLDSHRGHLLAWKNIDSRSELMGPDYTEQKWKNYTTIFYILWERIGQTYLLKLTNVSQIPCKRFAVTPPICLFWCLRYVLFCVFGFIHWILHLRIRQKTTVMLIRIGHNYVA